MEILGYLAAILIGISLGMLGSGGSILTVPVLVYLVGINPVISTAYSLFVVGTTAMVGSISYAKRKLLSYKTTLVFGIPSMISVFLTRKYIMPLIPSVIVDVKFFTITKESFLLLLFAVMMVIASISIIRDNKPVKRDEVPKGFNYPLILLEGIIVGGLTGLVGAGGGFLIVPALLLFSKLNMRMAVGTSLVIIAFKSLFGFIGDIANFKIDWFFLLTFTATSILGIFIGHWLAVKIEVGKLKAGFGYFILVMGVYIFLKELWSPSM